MREIAVNLKKLDERATLPTFGTSLSAGADLYALSEAHIAPGQTVMIGTGIALAVPDGYAAFVYARSGLATKRALAPANKVGVIDADYRGEILVALRNEGDTAQTVSAGERIAQLVIAPVVRPLFCIVEELDETARGAGGFGSTGEK